MELTLLQCSQELQHSLADCVSMPRNTGDRWRILSAPWFAGEPLQFALSYSEDVFHIPLHTVDLSQVVSETSLSGGDPAVRDVYAELMLHCMAVATIVQAGETNTSNIRRIVITAGSRTSQQGTYFCYGVAVLVKT